MIFDRLAIGTANWGKEYNGAKVSEDDQKRILDYCQCSGIDMIDTATAYRWDWTRANSYFNKIIKVQMSELKWGIIKEEPYCVMSHDIPSYIDLEHICFEAPPLFGASIYTLEDLNKISLQKIDVIQIPYNLYDRRFENYFQEFKCNAVEIHVRSIFLRGKLLKEFSPYECISFCLMNPYIDRVIIGADSFEQFKENLRPFHKMNVAEKHDENLLDPRKWK